MPLFAYGITTVGTETETEITLIDKAERLRRERIPMDTFSISCEWMKKYYDFSIKQEFDTDRYFITPWMRAEQTFFHPLRRFGIKCTLWTCCEYDLTHEQERRYYQKHPEAQREPRYDHSIRRNATDDMSIDANSRQFRDERLYAKRYHDPYTVPGEAWAEHFKKYFDLGVIGIAEDGSSVELTKVDHCYGNGYTAREMHNLCQSLNAYQYHHIYREHTGKRIFVRTPSTFIGHQRYCGTWCGDTTSETSLMGLLQYSFQGESNVTADMISTSREQIHFGMLMPWVLNFCWAHPVWPWMLTDDLSQCFRDYARLRYALMPYLYTAAYRSHLSGISMCSAMILHYPDDPALYNEANEYMLGDDFLVGAHHKEIYLPEGKWIDYWTRKEYDGKQRVSDGYPEDKGGYLFVKKGAIIPRWQEVLFVGEKPIDRMTVEIYPDSQNSYTLYEDDGESFAYEEGAFSLTDISYRTENDRITVTVSCAEGSYEGRPEGRIYDIELYAPCPKTLPDNAFYRDEKGAVCFSLAEGESITLSLS
jgi:alpha-glucosidase (family GH31 glycosyl hydrolase)